MIQVQYRNTTPIYEQIKQSILTLIRTGAIRENEQLPSVRELAEALLVHQNTIQRAYQELEEEGYLYKKTGCGTFCRTQAEICERQRKDHMCQFDEITKTLLSLSLDAETLKKRIDELAGGTSK